MSQNQDEGEDRGEVRPVVIGHMSLPDTEDKEVVEAIKGTKLGDFIQTYVSIIDIDYKVFGDFFVADDEFVRGWLGVALSRIHKNKTITTDHIWSFKLPLAAWFELCGPYIDKPLDKNGVIKLLKFCAIESGGSKCINPLQAFDSIDPNLMLKMAVLRSK